MSNYFIVGKVEEAEKAFKAMEREARKRFNVFGFRRLDSNTSKGGQVLWIWFQVPSMVCCWNRKRIGLQELENWNPSDEVKVHEAYN